MLLMLPASPTYNLANYCKPGADHPRDYCRCASAMAKQRLLISSINATYIAI